MNELAPAQRATERAAIEALELGEHGNPFAFLGPHRDGEGVLIRAWLPGAERVELLGAPDGETLGEMKETHPGLFCLRLEAPRRYLYRIHWPGAVQETEDPYAFGSLLGDLDIYLFSEGNHRQLGEAFGAQLARHDDVDGVRFAVWAPNARRVSVVGDFNAWTGGAIPCACATPRGCGSCSSRDWAWGRSTSSRSSDRKARCH